MINTNYYAVTCKCGHTGVPRSYTPITFAIKAADASEAEAVARRIPRVKHDSPTAILDLKPITYKDFAGINERNRRNEYLRCRSDEESKRLGVKIAIFREPLELPGRGCRNKKHRCSKVFCDGKVIIRNIKSYMRMHPAYNKEDLYE